MMDQGTVQERYWIIMQKKDRRIKVIHKENGGVSSARNKGIEVAEGDYIGFIDGDDLIELRCIKPW